MFKVNLNMPHDKQPFFRVNIVAFAAGIICLLVFLRALSCDFVNFDDHLSVLENKPIQSINGQMIIDVFKTSMYGFWMPLTWISYAIDYRIWGLDPFGFHLTNILLHAFNTGLVVLLTDRVLKAVSSKCFDLKKGLYPLILLFAGLLWGVHPLRVESVAWVTERKDVLNGLFTLLSILFYLHYAKKRDSGLFEWRCYLSSLALFICSLMAKPVTVVLPVMLLVLDWYPLGRMHREKMVSLLVEKLPFIFFSAVLSILTILTAVQKDMLVTTDRLSISERFWVAGNALFEYVRLFLLPTGILPLHPLPYPFPFSYIVASVVSLLVIVATFFVVRRSAAPLASILLFMLPLLPVIGFLQNGQQAFAARYTYLPHITLCIFSASMLLKIFFTNDSQRIRLTIAGLAFVLLVFFVLTQFQIDIWKNSGALWDRVIEKHKISMAYKSRGSFNLMNGRYSEAVSDFTLAMELAAGQEKLEIFNLLAGRGMALGSLGRLEESVNDFTAAINMFPHSAYYYSRGITFEAMGRMKEAQEDFVRAGPEPGDIKWFSYNKGLTQ